MTDHPSPWLGAQPMRGEWNAAVELFPKDFSRFVLPQNLDQLLDGSNAHTFRTYDDFIQFIEPAAKPPAKPKKSSAALKRVGISVLLTLAAILVIVGAAGTAVEAPVILGGVLLGFVAFCIRVVSLVEYLSHRSAESVPTTPHQQLVQSFGGEPAAALPVFIVDRLTMTAEENDVLDQCLGMYNYCQANSLPLNSEHWRALTQQALAQTRLARDTGAPKALTDLRSSIERMDL